MRVLFFGRLADAIGREVELDVPQSCSVADLRSTLAALFPQAADELARPSVRACIGDEIVPDRLIVEPGQTVEFLPTVSGG